MVLLTHKIGTLCIDYRPPETVATLVYDEGMFSEEDCDQFIITTKFFPGYLPLLPIYSLDARSYSEMRIKCYSGIDALDFVRHLDLREFDLKFRPTKMDSPDEERDEIDISSIYFEGERTEFWSMRIDLAGREEHLFLSNRDTALVNRKELKLVYTKAG